MVNFGGMAAIRSAYEAVRESATKGRGGAKVDGAEVKRYVPSAVLKSEVLKEAYLRLIRTLDEETVRQYSRTTGKRLKPSLSEEAAFAKMGTCGRIYFAFGGDGKPCGMLTVQSDPSLEDFRIQSLVVERGKRNSGIGTALMKRALSDCGGGRGIALNTGALNVAAQRLYRRFGFRPHTVEMFRKGR